MQYPKSDDYMIYNYAKHRYILTETDVFETLAINLEEKLLTKPARDRILEQISIHVYAYIHQFNADTKAQDYIIATTSSGRDIIKRAMEEQLIYELTVGDLSRATDMDKRRLWFDETAKEILLEDIPEIGANICYTGTLCLCINNFVRW